MNIPSPIFRERISQRFHHLESKRQTYLARAASLAEPCRPGRSGRVGRDTPESAGPGPFVDPTRPGGSGRVRRGNAESVARAPFAERNLNLSALGLPPARPDLACRSGWGGRAKPESAGLGPLAELNPHRPARACSRPGPTCRVGQGPPSQTAAPVPLADPTRPGRSGRARSAGLNLNQSALGL